MISFWVFVCNFYTMRRRFSGVLHTENCANKNRVRKMLIFFFLSFVDDNNDNAEAFLDRFCFFFSSFNLSFACCG